MPVLFHLHPRTQKMMHEFGIDSCDIACIQPVGYMEFLELEANARLVLTDPEGVQERGQHPERALCYAVREHRAAGDDKRWCECTCRNGFPFDCRGSSYDDLVIQGMEEPL